MSTSSELKDKEIKSREKIAREDRKSREEVARQDRLASVVGKSMPQFKIGINDPEWYTRIVGANLGNLNLSYFHRYNLPDPTISKGSNSSIGIRDNYPSYIGVYTVNYAPTIGSSRTDIGTGTLRNDVSGGAINAALNRVLSQLEKRNSRVTAYSRDTIGRYLFIGSDVLTDLLTLKVGIEIYDMAKTKFPYIAPALLSGLGFDSADFRSNIAWIKSEYVRLASVFNNSIPIPVDLSYVDRKIWVATHMIVDHIKSPAQMITFCKCVYYTLGSDDAYNAYPIQNGRGHQLIDYIRNIEDRIDALCNSATWKPVIRDLRGGMPERAFVKIPTDLTSTVHVISEVDEVREQFHNMDCAPGINYIGAESADLHMDPGLMFGSFSVGGNTKEQVCQGLGCMSNSKFTDDYRPGLIAICDSDVSNELDFAMDNFNNCFKRIIGVGVTLNKQVPLNFFHEEVKDVDLLTATRLKSTWLGTSLVATEDSQLNAPLNTETGTLIFLKKNKPALCIQPVVLGTELVLGVKAVLFDSSDPYDVIMNSQFVTYGAAVYSATYTDVIFSDKIIFDPINIRTLTYFQACLGLFEQLDWIPLIECVQSDSWTTLVQRCTIGELSNYVVIDTALLSRINRQCVESEFTINESAFLKPLS